MLKNFINNIPDNLSRKDEAFGGESQRATLSFPFTYYQRYIKASDSLQVELLLHVLAHVPL